MDHRIPKFFRVELSSTAYVHHIDVPEGGQVDRINYVSDLSPGPALAIFERGTKWSNVISNIYGIFVTQKSFGIELAESGCSGLDESYPVIINGGHWNWFMKNSTAAPPYVWIRIRQGIKIDKLSYQFPKVPISVMRAGIERMHVPAPGEIYRLLPVPGSHTGLDVFGADITSFLFCTRAFLEKCRERRWKGFNFHPMDLPLTDLAARPIDYLGKTWPPERWYPEGVEPHPANIDAP